MLIVIGIIVIVIALVWGSYIGWKVGLEEYENEHPRSS